MTQDEHALYGFKPANFISERNALVKSLKKAGQKDEAARISKLTKPSPSIWAVNQLARRTPNDLLAYLEAHHRARERQLRSLAATAETHNNGQEARNLADTAIRQERRLLDALVEHAHTFLAEENLSTAKTTIERVRTNLRAAVVHTETQSRLEKGCLPSDLEEPGFAALAEAINQTRPAWLETELQRLQQLRSSSSSQADDSKASIDSLEPKPRSDQSPQSQPPLTEELRQAETELQNAYLRRKAAEARATAAKANTDSLANQIAHLKAQLTELEAQLEDAQSTEALYSAELTNLKTLESDMRLRTEALRVPPTIPS